MPLLAILLSDKWDGKWAPYGAMLSLELYSARHNVTDQHTGSNYLFRIVYNGTPLKLCDWCSGALCDLSVLLDVLSFGQKGVPSDCDPILSPEKLTNEISSLENIAVSPLATSPPVTSIFLAVLISGISSALCMYFYMRKMMTRGSNTEYSRVCDRDFSDEQMRPL